MTTEGSAITDELRSMIGMTTEPVIHEVERGAIRRYADAIDDPNPLFRDVEYARGTKYGELICPPGFFGWAIKGGGVMELLGTVGAAVMRAGMPRILDGGVDYEFLLPIRAGDTLTSTGKFVDIREREGRSGKMLVLTLENTFLNQNGDLVAKARQNIIAR